MPTSIASGRGLLFPILLLAGPARAQVPAGYALTDVSGPGGGSHISLTGFSDTGFECGWLVDGGRSRGFRWSPGAVGSPSAFTLLDPPAEWGDYLAQDVNDAGTVIGLFGTSIGGFSMNRGYVWKDGEISELLTTEGMHGRPQALNDAGWIAGGEGARFGGPLRGLLWSPDLVPILVPEVELVVDVNDLGQMVGTRREGTAGTSRAYRLDGVGATPIPLGTLDPLNRGNVHVTAIDNRGHVVGECEVGRHYHAFLWTPETGMTELADLYPTAVGEARAADINDAGWIVGWTPGPTGVVDVLWAPDGTPVALEPLIGDIGGGTRWSRLFWAARINSSLQIAGGALTGTDVRHVLLTPARLTAGALAPGLAGVPNKLDVSGAKAGKPTFLFGDLDDGLDQGYTRVPGCGPIGLALARARFVSAATADGSGSSVHGWNVPAALAGVRVRLQALQLGGCGVSNVVRVAF